MKKNLINFTHPNKWSDSPVSPVESPSDATEIATDDESKVKLKKNRLELPPEFIIENYGKTKEIKEGLQKKKKQMWFPKYFFSREGINTPQRSS